MTIPPKETAVLQVLQQGGRFTQRQIARSEPFLECHRHELSSVPKTRQFETTLRTVRQLVRNLRVKYHQPILSDKDGYWLSTDINEAAEVIKRMEITAKAQTKAWHETYIAIRDNFGIESDYFNAQLKIDFE